MDVISDSPAIGLPETQPMGVELYFSNQLMPLADKLHENLKPVGRVRRNFGTSPVVIVPNMNLSKWIKLTLARKSDIFMNVEFQYLETGLWQMIRSLDARPIPEPERLDNDQLKILLFFILMAPDREAPDLEPVRQYLRLSDGGMSGDYEIAAGSLPRNCADCSRNMNITGLT
jgi:exonuclease V gamma subunit